MSTEAQRQGDSRRRQLEQSRSYAAEHGLDLIEDFEDIGVSAFRGKNIEHGALGRFLNLIKAKKIPRGSFLLIESLDRLSRQELLKSLSIFTEILNSGVNIVTLKDQHVFNAEKTDFPDLIISLGVMSRANEESALKSFRISKAWEQRRANAPNKKITSQCPSWLRLSNDKSKFEIIKDRAQLVRSIFQDSVAGLGNYAIAKKLNENGVAAFRSRTGWAPATIASVLSNKAVLGEFQPHKIVAGNRRPVGDPLAGYFPSIVKEDLFYRAEAARAQRRLGGGGRKGKLVSNIFSGLAKCAYCGSPMRHENKGEPPKGARFLICENHIRGLGCPAVRWRYDDFEASALTFIKGLDLATLLRTDQETIRRAELDAAVNASFGRVSAMEAERESVFALHQTVKDKQFLAAKLDEVSGSITKAKDELAKLKEQQFSARSAESRFHESKDEIKSLLARFKLADGKSADVYRLRSQIAMRLRSLVDAIKVASIRGAVREKDELEREKSKRKRDKERIAELERQLQDPWIYARSFMVDFKDGSSRLVYPSDDDPLQFKVQVVGTRDGLQSIYPDGRDEKVRFQ